MPPDDEELDFQPATDDEPLDFQPLDGAGAATPPPPPPPPAPKPTTAQANAAWADSLGPGQRAEALTRALRSGASEQDRARAQYLLGRHFDQSMGTEDTAAPIVGRDERPTAGLTGLAQGATLGFADELGGAMRAQAGEGSYQQERDRMRQQYRASREQAPGRTTQGEIAGTVPYAAIPGGGATAAERVAVQAGIGAGLGTASGAGFSEAETAPEVAEDAAMGGALGLALGGGGALVGEGVSAGVGRARAFADEADRLRVGSVMPGASRELNETMMRAAASRPGGIPGTAERIRGMGLVGPFSTAEDVAARTTRALEERGQQGELGAIYRALDEIAPVESSRLTGAMERQAQTVEADPVLRRFARPIRQRVEDFAETLPDSIGYQRAREILGALGDQTNWIDPATGARPPQDIARGTYRALRTELDDIAEEALGRAEPSTYREAAGGAGNAREAMQRFRDARQDTSAALFTQEWTDRALQRAARNRAISPTDYAAGIIGGQQGGLTGAALAAGANRLWRVREAPMRASAAEVVRSLLERNPQSLGRWAGPLRAAAQQGGSALAAAHMALSTRDPEYRRAIEEASNEAAEAPQE